MQCPNCGNKIPEGGAFCSNCGARVGTPMDGASAPPPAAPGNPMWYQNYYRIRKKVIAIADQYWIEDSQGGTLGYSKQKLLRLKEKISVFTDQSMSTELFRIEQEQIMDMWGTFAVKDSATGAVVGKLRRQALSSGFFKDEYLLLDPYGNAVGRVAERSGRGLVRKYIPLGARYECECGWHADKHVNAGINLLQTAFPKGEAGGLWFSPGAFQHDVMMVLYDPVRGARPEPNGTSC